MSIIGFQTRKSYRTLLAVVTALLLTLGVAAALSNGTAMAQPLSDETEIAELACSKEVNLSQAQPGEVLTYVITIQNTGAAAGTVLVTDSLPVELDVLPASVSADFLTPTVSNNLVTWQGDFLGGFGQTLHITVSAEITSDIGSQPIWITNTAEITGTGTPIEVSAVTQVADTYYYYLPVVRRNYPPIPTLNSVPVPDENGNYTVSWTAVDWPEVDRYVLQESTTSSFGSISNSWTTASTSQAIQHDLGSGTFYYRVRADDDDYWGEGPYSNIQSVTLPSAQPSYYYNFNHTGTIMNPWPIRRTSYWQGDVAGATWTEQPADHTDSIFIIMNDKFDFSLASPMEEAPDPPYVIETRVRIHEPANLVSYGVVFGANGGSPCPAYRDTGCFEHYYRLDVIWNGTSLKAGFKRIDYHEPESSSSRGAGRGSELISYKYVTDDHLDWHTWRFEVKPTGIDIYFDGGLYGSTSDTHYVNQPYFGIWAAANEYKPAIGRFDYFNVYPQ